jgi:Endonuclease-reverse transcriptase
MASSHTSLNIIQWNARSIYNKLDTLCEIIDSYKSEIVLISESRLNNNKNIKIKNFNIIRRDRDERGGGVAILIHKKYKIKPIIFPVFSSLEIVGLSVELKNNNCIDIVSVYIPPSSNPAAREIDEIFSHVKSPYIIGGDCNAHSTEWGCVEDTAKGITISDALDRNNATCLNDGSITRPQPVPLISSAIDLTITNVQNALNCEWAVIENTYTSDHYLINIKYKLSAVTNKSDKITVISYKKMKEKFEDENYIINNMQSINNYDALKSFIMQIKKESEVKIPEKYVMTRKPWWNNECSQALAKCRQASKQ